MLREYMFTHHAYEMTVFLNEKIFIRLILYQNWGK
jgi:hypothetical protein